MNSKLFRHCLGLAVGLGLFGGCARPSAQPTQPPTVSSTGPAPIVVQAPGAPPTAPDAAPPGPPEGQDPAPRVEQRIPPSQLATLATGIDEVAKLAQAGVSEEVILTYVEKYPGRFNVTADQIVYLNDLGVSTSVVNAMMKHDGTEGTVAPPQNVANAPAMPVNPAPQTDVQVGGNAPIATAPAAPSTEVTYFYDSLAPYGSWIYVADSGWCWQPTVAVRAVNWQPYCDSGRWYWSDSGWYWHSDYSWGWAPFHYGRWYHHATCGWLWTPGVVWGPAWVSWRYSAGYCGWAPLPPAAIWVSGGGFSYHGRHVDVGFDFGLSYHHYAFVPVGRFCDPHPWRERVPRTQVVNVYRNTTVVNNYRVNNGTIVNNGVGRETIARHNANDFRQVKVQQANFAGGSDRMSRIEKRGNDLVAYRPQLPKEPPVKPSVVQSRMENQARAARLENNRPAGAAVPRVGRGNVNGDGRASSTVPAPRANPSVDGTVPRNSGGATVPRVERPNPGTPQRIPQERNRSGEVPRNNPANSARLNEAPRTPATTPVTPRVQQAPQVATRSQSPANVPSPRVGRESIPQARPAPQAQAPVATAPSIPRNSSAPHYSPRYTEQYNGSPRVYSAPSAPARPVTPSYNSATPRAVAPATPSAPRNVAPSGGGSGGGHGGGGGRRSDR